ncbi:hypothetical protein VNO77_29698 [Canavalia gladiata]|uniref:Cytochrome P450 n=1 Tax=Canavalia gladiata TaxID=3824 RepID=A0AAN9KQC3_CANGL
MEDHFLSFHTLSYILLLILIILKVVKRFKNSGRTSKLPPGPWKLPILGSLHHLICNHPHKRLRELSQKYGPLMHLQLGETSAIVVSSPEIAKEVFKTHGVTFAHRPHFVVADIVTYGCTDIALSPYGDYWKMLRKICTLELFSPKRVRSFKSIREEEVSNLITYISMNTGSPINLSDKVSAMQYKIVSRAVVGDKCMEQDAYILFIKKFTKINETFGMSNFFPSQNWLHVVSGIVHKLKELQRTGDMLLDNVIKSATANTGDRSLLSVLLNLKDDSPEFHLTLDNIKAIIQDMFIGGIESPSSTVDWAFSEMMKNPRVLKRAQAEVREVFGSMGCVDEMALQELKYLKAIIKETFRLHPPSPLLFPRECGETCEINGYTIPVGTQVYVNAWAIGRDPKYWIDADKFYPERFLNSPIDYKGSNFELIPFGAGKRICPGIMFSEPNIELPLAQLLYYFNWELPFGTSPQQMDMTETFGGSGRRISDLFVVPVSYNVVPVE